MTGFLIASAIGIAAILGLALALPCEGCRLRRKRMRQAYDRWRARRPIE
jgi:hypothetical protein